ncbi:uncharacterized protein miip isoform X2 [Stegostoma tigrinum]|uniref:uncharacterized protein miip isoform X2 n=1 Tax=Stegostoma tigrinum TaxID=3053191 RepID=UPI0028704796|nr:uncharacterized protein miip isoform X2 [Stegostoma tigrinum]
MSHSDYLQSLRDQNKHLLQKLRLKQLKIPWNVPVPLDSGDGSCRGAIKSVQSRSSTEYQENCNDKRAEKGRNSLKNPNMKDQTHSELPGPEMYEDGLQQFDEVVVTESRNRKEASRAALFIPLAHRSRKHGWTLVAGDGAGVKQSGWLLGSGVKVIPNIEQNCSLSVGMSPKGRLNAMETLDCKLNKLKPEARPRSTPCKLLTDSYVSKNFKCSTPFTKPPSAPGLMKEPEYPASVTQLCRDVTSFKENSPRHHSHFLQNFCEDPKRRSKLEPPLYVEQLLDEGNDRCRDRFIRDIQKPKPILLESCDEVAKVDTGHVTFLSPKEESNLRAQVQAVRPFLGYDWIAGLMDINSPLSEKSEQYFLDLQDFRRVNKDECVHQEYMEAEELDVQATDQEKLDYNCHVHQCTHSYRVNNRLFAVPLESAAPCPICKTPKSKQSHTLEEPAYIRVSIPRSTLLPPHKYKLHRRKSFDPTDSLSLPSHCLLGWRNALPSTTPIANTLDLRSTVEAEKISSPLALNLSNPSPAASRVAGGTRSDELLNLTHLTAYQFQRLRLDCPYSTS